MINKHPIQNFWAISIDRTECSSPLQERGKVGRGTCNWEGDIQQLWCWEHGKHHFQLIPHYPPVSQERKTWLEGLGVYQKGWFRFVHAAGHLPHFNQHTSHLERHDRGDYGWETTIGMKQEKSALVSTVFSLQKGPYPPKLWVGQVTPPCCMPLVPCGQRKRKGKHQQCVYWGGDISP